MLAHVRIGSPAVVATVALSLVFGCSDPELEDDPELAVEGFEVTPAPPVNPMLAAATEFDPELAVPDYDPLPAPPMPPGMPPGGMPPGGMPPGGMPPGGMPPGGVPPEGMQPMQPSGPVALAPGFQPDPMVLRGALGGPIDASTMSPGCVGQIGQQPNHILQVGQDFRFLRIVVNSQADATLVVRAPDGSFRCNDDAVPQTEAGGAFELNPLIEGAFGPGAYTIWVGRWGSAEPAPYAIGFTELSSVTAQHIR